MSCEGCILSQEAAVEAWKEACSMRRSGKEPSRLNLASYFASALEPDTEVGAPEVIPQVHLLLPLT